MAGGDNAQGHAHNKVMVIDRQTVVTGSFSFTKTAEEKNAENLLIIKDAGLVNLYLEDLEQPKFIRKSTNFYVQLRDRRFQQATITPPGYNRRGFAIRSLYNGGLKMLNPAITTTLTFGIACFFMEILYFPYINSINEERLHAVLRYS